MPRGIRSIVRTDRVAFVVALMKNVFLIKETQWAVRSSRNFSAEGKLLLIPAGVFSTRLDTTEHWYERVAVPLLFTYE